MYFVRKRISLLFMLLVWLVPLPSFAWNSLLSGGTCQQSKRKCYTTIGNAGDSRGCCDPRDAKVLFCATQNKCLGGRIYRWADSRLPLKWYWNPNNLPGTFAKLDKKGLENALKNAWNAWSDPVCTRFRHAYSGNSNAVPNSRDGKLVLYFASPDIWALMGVGTFTLAFSQPRPMGSGELRDADITFNPNPMGGWGLPPVSDGSVDFTDVAAHEVGHSLGFGHTAYPTALMYYSARGRGPLFNGLSRDEIQGVCSVYPQLSTKTCQRDVECGRCAKCVSGSCAPPQKRSTACPCNADSDCEDGLTCKAKTCVRPGGGVQMDACDPVRAPCSKTYHCFRIQRGDVCLLPCGKSTGLPPGTQGSACLSDGSCAGKSRCYLLENGRNACVQPCKTQEDCSDGGKCTTTTFQGVSQKFCLCQGKEDCGKDQVCHNSHLGGVVGVCAKQDNTKDACPANTRCGSTQDGTSACFPIPGKRKLGEDCTDKESCEKGLLCVLSSPTEGKSICVEDCTTSRLCSSGGACVGTFWKNSLCFCYNDKQCPAGKFCKVNSYGVGVCVKPVNCGNGKCDVDLAENCTTCPDDCGCKNSESCDKGSCVPDCGNGTCEPALGEDCGTCSKDCVCDDGYQCNFDSCVKKPKEEPKAPEPAPSDASSTQDRPTCPAGQQLSTCSDNDPNCERLCISKDGCQCQSSSALPSLPIWLVLLLGMLTLFRRRRA